jgi:hypothetical protein
MQQEGRSASIVSSALREIRRALKRDIATSLKRMTTRSQQGAQQSAPANASITITGVLRLTKQGIFAVGEDEIHLTQESKVFGELTPGCMVTVYADQRGDGIVALKVIVAE